MKRQAKVKTVKIGMVKIVVLVLLMIGMNIQAEIINDKAYKSKKDLAESNGIFVIPIKIFGVDSFVAALVFDYRKATKYTKPTIALQIPVDENNYNTISFESYALSIYELNKMAKELGIVLNYCSQATYNQVFPEGELTVNGNYALCATRDIIDLDQAINMVKYKMIEK